MTSSDQHRAVRRRRWPRRLGIASGLIACAVGILWIYANHAARGRVADQLTQATGLVASVESAHLQWRGGVTARRIVLGPPENPIATIGELVIRAPLSTLATSPDIQHLLVKDARLRLEVTDDGRIDWPFATSPDAPFPPNGVDLQSATLQLSQADRTSWEAKGIAGTLNVEPRTGTLHVDLQAADVDDAQWTLLGTIDSHGQAHFDAQADHFAFEPNTWAQRPLVPPWVEQIPSDFRGAITLSAQLDAQQQPVQVDLQLANGSMQLAGVEQHLHDVSAKVRLQPHRFEVSTFQAFAESTELTGQLTTNVVGSSLMGDWKLTWRDLSLKVLADRLPQLNGLQGRSSGELHGDFVRRNSTVRARCEGPIQLADATYLDTAIPNLATDVQLSQVSFSLDETSDITKWTITANADCESFVLAGERFQHVNADVQLHEGRFIVSGEATLNGAQSRYVFGVDANLGDATSRGKIMLAGQQVSATSLLASVDRIGSSLTGVSWNVPPLEGDLTFDVVLDVPSSAPSDVSQWSGSFHAHAPSVKWGESSVNRLHLVGQLVDAQLELTKGSAAIGPTGSLQFAGQAPVSGTGDVTMTVSARMITLDDLLQLGERRPFVDSPLFAKLISEWRGVSGQGTGLLPGGTLTCHGTIRVPVSQLTDRTSWKIEGNVQLDQLVLHGEKVERCSFDLLLNNGTIQAKPIELAFSSGGRLQGMAVIPWASSETSTTTVLQVDWIDLPLAAVDRIVPIGREASGLTTGRLRVSGPTKTWTDLSRLDGSARMIFRDLKLGSESVGSYNAVIDLRPSEDIVAKVWNRQGTPKFQVQATIGREAPYSIQADLLIVDRPIQDLLPRDWLVEDRFQVQGRASTHSRLVGSLSPRQLAATGHAKLTAIEVGAESIPDMTLRFRTHPDQGTQLHLRAECLGGVAEGQVDLPWIKDRAPQASISFHGLQASQLQQIASTILPPEIELVGEFSGTAQFVSWNDLDRMVAVVQTEGMTAHVGGIPVNAMAIQLRRDETKTQYTATGKLLEGGVTVAGEVPSSQTEWPAHVTIESARLNQLRQHRPRFKALDQLAGEIELDLDVSFDSQTQQLTGAGTLAARNVSWQRERLIPRANARLTLQDGMLLITELEADVAQGVVSGRLTVPITSSQLGSYDLTARRVALNKTIELLAPHEGRIQGTWSGRFSGSLGPSIVGRGQVEMRNVAVNRVPLSTVRVPVTYFIDVQSWDGRLSVQRAQARAAGGQITADAVVSFGHQNDLKLDVALSRVDTGLLTQNLTRSSSYDQGRITGKLQVQARRFQSLRDLEGTFRGELEDAQSMRLPVFSDLVSFANISQVSREPLDSETLSLRISRGIISTPGVVLRSNGVEIFLQGQMDVNERLDFDVAVQSGNVSPDFGLSELVRSPAATLAVPGVAVPLQVLDFLQNRVLYLHVGGTVRNPSFQIRTDRQIQQELIRYYLPTMTLPASRTNP